MCIMCSVAKFHTPPSYQLGIGLETGLRLQGFMLFMLFMGFMCSVAKFHTPPSYQLGIWLETGLRLQGLGRYQDFSLPGIYRECKVLILVVSLLSDHGKGCLQYAVARHCSESKSRKI